MDDAAGAARHSSSSSLRLPIYPHFSSAQPSLLSFSRIVPTSPAKSRPEKTKAKEVSSIPFVISKSVTVCHLSVATNQESPFRRQLRSMTSLSLSLFREARRASRRGCEKVPAGKRCDVIITWRKSEIPVSGKLRIMCLTLRDASDRGVESVYSVCKRHLNWDSEHRDCVCVVLNDSPTSQVRKRIDEDSIICRIGFLARSQKILSYKRLIQAYFERIK